MQAPTKSFTVSIFFLAIILIVSNNPKPMSQILRDSSPARFLIAGLIGSSFLGLAGLTLTGITVAVVVATPILALFSPIILPTAAVVALITTGFMFSGGFLAAGLAAVVWIYHYVTGKHLVAADCIKLKVGSKTKDGEMLKENENA